MPNKERIREVKELKIYCTNHEEGCEWEGKLGELKRHLESDKGCGYVEVTCSNKECRAEMMRSDLKTHLQEECDSLDCPNKCGVTGIRRTFMPGHRNTCPLEPFNCPFKDAGCNEKIARKDMEDHMTANQQKHILLSFQSFQHMKWSIGKEIEDLRSSICRTSPSLESMKESTEESLSRMELILNSSLKETEDKLMFRVADYPQLRKEKKVWHSPPFTIDGKVRVCLAVYPSGVGTGQGSHVSVSLILVEDLMEDMPLEYDMSVALLDEYDLECESTTMELCTSREGDDDGNNDCSAYFFLPSPGGVL